MILIKNYLKLCISKHLTFNSVITVLWDYLIIPTILYLLHKHSFQTNATIKESNVVPQSQKFKVCHVCFDDIFDWSLWQVRFWKCDQASCQQGSPHTKCSVRHYGMIGKTKKGQVYPCLRKVLLFIKKEFNEHMISYN